MSNKFLKDAIIGIGDTHTLDIVPLLKRLPKDFSNWLFIHVGDAGEGFSHPLKEQRILSQVRNFLEKRNSNLIVCRGNHSNPDFFSNDHWANKQYGDRVYFAPDYSVFEVNDKTIQVIGGGISIDRVERLYGKTYWESESVNFQPERVQHVDVLVTHVAPSSFALTKFDTNPMVNHFCSLEAMQGGDLASELKQEREQVQILSDLSKCRKHFFGHYHRSDIYEEKGRLYRCLAINEFVELQ